MRINHFIIGVKNLNVSMNFYISLFGFKDSGSFIDTGTQQEGKVLTYPSTGADLFQVLLVPFVDERHPNPQHIAFEVNTAKFDMIYQKAKKQGLKVRTRSALDCEEEAPGFLDSNGHQYKNFYVLDPANINIEIMTRCKT